GRAERVDNDELLPASGAFHGPAYTIGKVSAGAVRDVPILAVKAGRTRAGQLTASSHTGALAGEDALADAFLRRHGIVRVADFRELAEYCQIFVGGQRPRGDGVVAISNSGATCVLAADAAE
ncbi:hypothetical protein ABTD78_19160, partial [Acinetobacter baumannii]